MKRALNPLVIALLTTSLHLSSAHAANDDLDIDDLKLDEETQTTASPQGDLGEFDEFEDITTESDESSDKKAQSASPIEDELTLDEPAQVAEPDVPPPQIDEPAPELPKQAEAPAQMPEPSPAPQIAASTQASTQVASQSQEPNQALEKRLFEIYIRYHQKPIADSEWNSIVGSKRDEEYQVQNGNTLWDISHTFFGDGNFWPKVWSMNGGILNPHLIVPGMKIVFTPGDMSHAPKLAFNSTGLPTQAAPSERGDGRVEIPPPSKVYTPVLMKFPASLPVLTSSSKRYDKIGFDGSLKDPIKVSTKTALMERMVDELPQAIGEVIEVEGGMSRRASPLEYIYVRATNGLQIGQRLHSYRIKSDSEPSVVILEGDLTVTDVISQENQVYKVLINRAIDAVRVGSSVAAGRVPSIDYSQHGKTSQVQANIIGGQNDNERKFVGLGEMMFLDKGSNDGLHVNDLLTVIGDNRKRNPDSEVDNVGQVVGFIKVVDVSSTHATALLLGVRGVVYVGDFTASGDLFKKKNSNYKGRNVVDVDDSPTASHPEESEPREIEGEPELDLGSSDSASEPMSGLEEDLSLDGDSAAPPASDSGSDLDLDLE